ncbi:MAG: peptide-methionine (S)-S-oxide reductase MsrA [Sphingomonadales bacterium]|nr:peptide-methionine (S)-S-oxide reductase MsrA [Sphingomonadaceae bacterium]MBS3932155.1 peptide-methionine (S)-S-oxide reductase MsrA [Sphingomonadales bacterium]
MLRPTLAVLLLFAAPGTAHADTIVLAGGCFWGMEATFEHVKGVTNVVSGYAGGSASDATYDLVSAEKTDHAEAIRVTYDPAKVSLGDLLGVYFLVAHDPTQLNRQTPDEGRSYRSAVFPQNAQQRIFVEAYIKTLNAKPLFRGRIVTKIESGQFYPAETYHQDFMRKNPRHPYILRWDVPKVKKLKVTYPALFKG